MCLVVTAVEVSPRYPLILCANREERHARPTAPAHWWQDHPDVLGGRDLVAGGGWLALNRRGRLAAVTNVRDPGAGAAARSRGKLVTDYLTSADSLDEFTAALRDRAAEYGPFNLLLLDGANVHCVSNRAPPVSLGSGIHALSNAVYGVGWPKLRTARAGVEALVQSPAPLDGLFALLARRAEAEQGDEGYRAAHFIDGPTYGTRSSTVVLIDSSRGVTFAERSFDDGGRVAGDMLERFTLDAPLKDGRRTPPTDL